MKPTSPCIEAGRLDVITTKNLVRTRNDVEAAAPVEPQRVAEPRPGVEAHEAPALGALEAVFITNDEADGVGHAAQRHLALDGPGGEPVGEPERRDLALRDDITIVLVEVQRDELPPRLAPRRGRRVLIDPADLLRQRRVSPLQIVGPDLRG